MDPLPPPPSRRRPPAMVQSVAEAREADARAHAAMVAAARAAYGPGGLPGTPAEAEEREGGGRASTARRPPPESDADALARAYRFLPTEEDLAAGAAAEASRSDDPGAAWGAALARSYYARLFREYAIVDLTRASASSGGLVGLRWRTREEVVAGRGHLTCGARPACAARAGLETLELPFEYEEGGRARRALVKVRLCPAHAAALGEAREAARRRGQKA